MKSKFKKVLSTCLATVMLLSTAVVAPITASSAETQAVITGEIKGEPKLRYDYVCCNVCNKCLKPMMYKDGRTFNNREIGAHMQREHGGGSWHSTDH